MEKFTNTQCNDAIDGIGAASLALDKMLEHPVIRDEMEYIMRIKKAQSLIAETIMMIDSNCYTTWHADHDKP